MSSKDRARHDSGPPRPALLERTVGPEHAQVADSLYILAMLDEIRGSTPSPEYMIQRVVAMRERVFGTVHREVAQGLNNLANLYYAQGAMTWPWPNTSVRSLFRRDILEVPHPYIAQSLHNVALAYYAQGQVAAAEVTARPHAPCGRTR